MRGRTFDDRYDVSPRTRNRLVAGRKIHAVYDENGNVWITVASAEAWAAGLAPWCEGVTGKPVPGFEPDGRGGYARASKPKAGAPKSEQLREQAATTRRRVAAGMMPTRPAA
jgi:hypothetical protein